MAAGIIRDFFSDCERGHRVRVDWLWNGDQSAPVQKRGRKKRPRPASKASDRETQRRALARINGNTMRTIQAHRLPALAHQAPPLPPPPPPPLHLPSSPQPQPLQPSPLAPLALPPLPLPPPPLFHLQPPPQAPIADPPLGRSLSHISLVQPSYIFFKLIKLLLPSTIVPHPRYSLDEWMSHNCAQL